MFRRDSLVTLDYPYPSGYSVSWHPSAPKQRRYGLLALLQRTSTVGRPIHSFTLPTPATFVSNVVLHHAVTLLLTVAVAQSRNKLNCRKSLIIHALGC
jgi:hypothetical protein